MYNTVCMAGTQGLESSEQASYRLEEGEEVGDGGAGGLSAIGDGGQAAIHSHLTWLDMQTYIHVFESLQLEGSYVAALIYTYTYTHVHTQTHAHTMEDYSVIKKNEILPSVTTSMTLEGITLSEMGQIERKKTMISFTMNPKIIQMNDIAKQTDSQV